MLGGPGQAVRRVLFDQFEAKFWEVEASARVMRRLGMTYRGVEQWHDEEVAVYGITRSEWQQRA